MGFAGEFGTHLGHRIGVETKSISNKAWYLQARKKGRSRQDYAGLSIEDDWVSLTKVRKLVEERGESPLPEDFDKE